MATGFPVKGTGGASTYTSGSVLSSSDLNDLGGTLNSLNDSTNYPYAYSNASSPDAIRRPLPFAVSADKIAFSGTLAAGSGASATVLFNTTSRFTQVPVVTATANSSGYVAASVGAISTTGFTARIFNPSSTTISAGYSLHFIAIQMTYTSPTNS